MLFVQGPHWLAHHQPQPPVDQLPGLPSTPNLVHPARVSSDVPAPLKPLPPAVGSGQPHGTLGRHHLTVVLLPCVCRGVKDVPVPSPCAPRSSVSPFLRGDPMRPSRGRVAPGGRESTDPSPGLRSALEGPPTRAPTCPGVHPRGPRLPGLDSGMTRGKWRREGLRGLWGQKHQCEVTRDWRLQDPKLERAAEGRGWPGRLAGCRRQARVSLLPSLPPTGPGQGPVSGPPPARSERGAPQDPRAHLGGPTRPREAGQGPGAPRTGPPWHSQGQTRLLGPNAPIPAPRWALSFPDTPDALLWVPHVS